ncbi:hypothetical protein [Mariniblastus fucicola]|uniref:Uncharacterized protein n=1 Tax=Mariniblastus fucicola TaxID=980251 RepID=A0A5B9PD80_9BACT|nr:hypothetical protein [Mariniblastus fucicola]QEG23050.1 hypothetical protein MFFC18_29420 [Mariniblastus fucicola]
MSVSISRNVLFTVVMLTQLLVGETADAQQKWELPGFDPPPREVVEEDAVYAVYFAAPAQTGYMVVNERGSERGPYESWEAAQEAGMEQWWILFDIEEVQLPQTWYYWQTFEDRHDAEAEVAWFRRIGFDAKITTIWNLRLRPGSIDQADWTP